MSPSDAPGPFSSPVEAASPPAATQFQSILFERPQEAIGVDDLEQPEFFADMT